MAKLSEPVVKALETLLMRCKGDDIQFMRIITGNYTASYYYSYDLVEHIELLRCANFTDIMSALVDFEPARSAPETTASPSETAADKGILTEEELRHREMNFQVDYMGSIMTDRSFKYVQEIIKSHRNLLSANAELSFKNQKYKQSRFAFTEIFNKFEKAYMDNTIRTDSLNDFNSAFRGFMYEFMMINPNETLEELK